MRQLKNILFSTKTMTVLLLLYAISMAVATFVENDYDTPTAKALIYDAKWFELLMLWLIVIFIANIKTYKLTEKRKLPVLAFHLAFVLMFIGGGITRYISFEGQMPIAEGETTHEIISDKTYFLLDISDKNQTLRYDKVPYQMSYFNAKETKWPFKRTYEQSYQFNDKIVTLKTLDYIPLAKDSIHPTASGKKMLALVTMGEGGRENHYIADGDIKKIGGLMFSFNNPIQGTVQLMEDAGEIVINAPFDGQYMSMQGQQMGAVTDSALLAQQSGKIEANVPFNLNYRALYSIHNESFIIPKPAFTGEIVYYKGDKTNMMDKNLLSVVQLELSSGNEKDTVMIKGGSGITGFSKKIHLNGLDIAMGFGSKIIQTPFSLRCDKFTLERYPGSTNPSSYESRITVIDKGKETQHHIYMNNVMDYNGYRFFQASYFPDETGTILSVNKDWWGTNITYMGYFLLFFGMFITLFWKGTHFWNLNRQLKGIHKRAAILLPFLWMGFAANAQDLSSENASQTAGKNEQVEDANAHHKIDVAHANRFGYLMVQDFQGRIKPMNTHVLELLRKIHKKDYFRKADGEKMSAEQWFLSMQTEPMGWVNEPLIKVGAKAGEALLKELKVNSEGYTKYSDLLNMQTGKYALEQQYNTAFSKRKADQSNYDKEVINVTERFNIFNNIVYGYYTKVIPVKNDAAETWHSWVYTSASNQMEIDSTAIDIIGAYLTAVKEGIKSNEWKMADEKLEEITAYQHQWGKNVVLSDRKIKLEVLYNKANLFLWLMIAYSILGIALVMLAFAEVLTHAENKLGKTFHFATKLLIGIMIIALIIQLITLGVRWYLSGHAPWSNGYEAIVFISAVGVFSGLLLYKNRNAFIPASGALVAMIMMGFAHGGSMLDPQITPLEPVLKSYWLMVHVGIITSSYGFFGLSAVIAGITLIMYCLQPSQKIKSSIRELTIVNEMAAEIGVFALTVGTFLGGMWANESWGRYWSWDPKETWAFISVIFYAVILHFRIVPGLRDKWIFNVASMWMIWTVIFTYFGVNYYLSGLHSYAAGDPMPIPYWIPLSAAAMLMLSIVSYLGKKKYEKFVHPLLNKKKSD